MAADKFNVVDDATVVLREKGVYKQAGVFTLGKRLFAEYRKGHYIALLSNAGTSAPAVSWSDLDTPFGTVTRDGRVVKP